MSDRPHLFGTDSCPVGLFVLELFSPNLWPLLTLGGLDFAVVDLEHSRFTSADLGVFAAGAQTSSIPLLARLPTLDQSAVGRALDLGASGVIVSRIESGDDAESLVRFAKFAPRGRRNAAFGVAYDSFRSDGWAETAAWANARTLCIPLVETANGVRRIREICAVPDIDAVWLGPADLSQSLGRLGAVDAPEYREAEEQVLEACRERGIPVGVWARNDEEIRRQLGRGFSAIAIGTDAGLLVSALRERVTAVKEIAARAVVRGPGSAASRR